MPPCVGASCSRSRSDARARPPGQGSAHVAPSVDDNNRYLKLTPARRPRPARVHRVLRRGPRRPDRARRSTPTATARSAIAEAQAFGDRLGGEVAAALDVAVDGVQQRIAWTTVVGRPGLDARRGRRVLGRPRRVPLPPGGARAPRGPAARSVPRAPPRRDRGPGRGRPGRLDRARADRRPTATRATTYRFVGPGGPLSDDGLDLAFTASEQAVVAPDATCRAAAAGGRAGRGPAGLIAGAAAAGVAAALAAAGVTVVRRRRRRRDPAQGARR